MAIAFQQVKTLYGPHPGSPFTIVFTNPTVSGNTVIIAYAIGSGTTYTIYDNFGNNFIEVSSFGLAYTGVTTHIISAYLTTGGSSHAITITPSSDSNTELTMEEWSGISQFGAFDRSTSNSGTDLNTNPGATSSTRVADELIWSAAQISIFDQSFANAVVASGSGFSHMTNTANYLYNQSKVVSSTGIYDAPYSVSLTSPPVQPGYDHWSAGVVTLASTNATTTTSTSSSTSSTSTSSTSHSTSSTSTSHSSTSVSSSTSHSTSLSTSSTSSSTSHSTSTTTLSTDSHRPRMSVGQNPEPTSNSYLITESGQFITDENGNKIVVSNRSSAPGKFKR